MIITTLSATGAVISVLLVIIAGTYERKAQRDSLRFEAEVARDVKHWQRGAATLFAISALPSLISRPQPELAEAVYDSLDALAPMFLLLASLCFVASINKVIPAWRRYKAQREQDARRRQIAAQGAPYPEISAAVAQSLSQCLPDMELQTDVRDKLGNHASLLLQSGEENQRYVVYALPRDNLFVNNDSKKGSEGSKNNGLTINHNALLRAANAAKQHDARPILWTPLGPKEQVNGYYAPVDWDPRPYVVEGKDIHLAETVKKFELTARSERRRRESREAARKAKEGDPRYHVPVRTDTSAERGRNNSNRDEWERFNLLAPRHPHIQEVIRRRAHNLCDKCVQNIVPEENSKIVVTDHEHVCKNDASIRIVLEDSPEQVPQNLPDCAQCHYEHPEYYESCVSRLTLVHSGNCPDVHKNAERDAELDRQEKLAELGRSFKG
ncbi:hypothetical protein HH1059_08330 [Halorhodospira halochloris]|uniref:Uncharacterized protein n=1 Tax=Halorhodospira halochloris TaxID=1052 RepID=A0A0X8X8N8_HALHR|nr:hypothetical protein [Halorhodospira halochloris]MBK1651249.1 hypothetical protein [Halorhodospira halochloris]MCG5548581.1 hypothetical protein [Halorhodospira halochloris]BAU57526.2 hypothetical protein HH1059_08330 [Halorhodospira halochloris]